MWLILAGLTLLAGDVLSQANKVINSETDLLALESDQLIHSSAELLALEDGITGLPFGTKLPGNKKPIFAYQYTIKDDKNDEQDQHLTTVHKLPAHSSYDTSKNTIYLQNLKILDQEKENATKLDKNTLEKSNDISTRSTASNDRVVYRDISQFSSDCEDNKNNAASYSAETSAHIPINKKLISQEYLPPPSSKLTLDYLPPLKNFQSTVILNRDYLPPAKEFEIPILHREYLPPTKDMPKIPALSLDYLPPTKEIVKTTPLDREYLPPTKDIPIVNRDYLPPKKISPAIPILNDDYLPPRIANPAVSEKEFSTEKYISQISLDYLPPKKEASISDKELPLSTLNLDYLPPDKSYPTRKIIQEYIPPVREHTSKPLIPISISREIEHPIFPFAISPTVVPSSVKSKIIPGEASLTVYLPSKKQFIAGENFREQEKLGNASFGPATNPPIGIRRKESKVTPDVVTEEIIDQLVIPKAERNKAPTLAVIYEHKDAPVKAIGEYTKYKSPVASEIKSYERPDISFKEHIDQPIRPTSKYSDIKNYVSVEEEKLLRKTIPIIADTTKTKDQPIRPVPGETPTTHSPIEIVSGGSNKNEYVSSPIALQSNQIVNNQIIPLAHYTKVPLSVTYKESQKIHPYKSISSPYVVEGETNYICLSNDHCPESCICHNSQCILGCTIASNLCIGDATCETRHHVPACVCPLMFIAKTVETSGSLQFDCVPMAMPPSTNLITDSQIKISSRIKSTSCFIRYPTAPLRPIAPISGFHQRPIIAPVRSTASFVAPISHSPSFVRGSGAACSPSPCGPNTRCEENSRGVALCRCVDDYVPDGHTINGCKPQCVSESECPDDYQCQNQKCVRVCIPGACGLYADCDARNHRAVCSCPQGYNGDPHNRCNRNLPEVRIPQDLPVDPCVPNPCGANADCKERGDRAVCSCPIGYEGNPLTNCIKGECLEHRDCPGHLACQGLRCIDPCVGVCGSGSECTVRNNQPVCSCPRNHIGDPFSSCRRITEYDVCNPTPCGQNTNCKAKTERDGGLRAVCSCIDNYIGSPLTGCRAECDRDTDCNPSQHCRNNRCRNPCVDGCGDGAYCDVRSHQAVCTCPEHFLGDPHSRCYTECTEHDDCRDFEACSLFRCVNPCEGACGTGADCKVEKHTPICSCPRGYTGDPFVSCRAFTLEDLCRDNPCGTNAECHPGKDRSGNDRPVCTCPRGYIGNPLISCRRGDCEDHNTCPDHQACYGYVCQSPCVTETGSVCGQNADCKVKNHTPVCSCPRGYGGNPIEECRISPSARIAGRSHRKQ